MKAILLFASSAYAIKHLPEPLEDLPNDATWSYTHKNHEINDLVSNTIKKTRDDFRKSGVPDWATRDDEKKAADREAVALTDALTNRILNTKQGDYSEPGKYPKFFDLSNKIAALHAWHTNVLDQYMTSDQATETAPEVDAVVSDVE